MTKNYYILIVLTLLSVGTYAQSKKEVKKNGIKSCMIIDTENGKTTTDKKTLFEKNGEVSEETEYDKNGGIKVIHKYKYNKVIHK